MTHVLDREHILYGQVFSTNSFDSIFLAAIYFLSYHLTFGIQQYYITLSGPQTNICESRAALFDISLSHAEIYWPETASPGIERYRENRSVF